jgi:uncharacterized Zn-binding protein involved in type VI secretion
MAIFGTIDAKALANNLSVTNNSTTVTTTGDFTDRTSANFVQNGDVLSLGGVQYTVESVVSATSLKLRTAYAGSTGTVLAANAIRRTPPKEVATLLLDENGQLNHFPTGTKLIFIDDTEAALDENKVRGLKWPGWWAYRTYTDGDGNTRHKAECLAFANATAGVAVGDYAAADGGTEDNPAADVASAVTITGQPAAVTGAATPYTGTFAVTTSTTGTPGTLLYQWQYQTASQTTKWTNLTDTGVYSGTSTATLTLTAAAKATYDGYKFRVKITSAGGTEEIISNAASLTYA